MPHIFLMNWILIFFINPSLIMIMIMTFFMKSFKKSTSSFFKSINKLSFKW